MVIVALIDYRADHFNCWGSWAPPPKDEMGWPSSQIMNTPAFADAFIEHITVSGDVQLIAQVAPVCSSWAIAVHIRSDRLAHRHAVEQMPRRLQRIRLSLFNSPSTWFDDHGTAVLYTSSLHDVRVLHANTPIFCPHPRCLQLRRFDPDARVYCRMSLELVLSEIVDCLVNGAIALHKTHCRLHLMTPGVTLHCTGRINGDTLDVDEDSIWVLRPGPRGCWRRAIWPDLALATFPEHRVAYEIMSILRYILTPSLDISTALPWLVTSADH